MVSVKSYRFVEHAKQGGMQNVNDLLLPCTYKIAFSLLQYLVISLEVLPSN